VFEAKATKNKKADHGTIQKKPEGLQEQKTKNKEDTNKKGRQVPQDNSWVISRSKEEIPRAPRSSLPEGKKSGQAIKNTSVFRIVLSLSW